MSEKLDILTVAREALAFAERTGIPVDTWRTAKLAQAVIDLSAALKRTWLERVIEHLIVSATYHCADCERGLPVKIDSDIGGIQHQMPDGNWDGWCSSGSEQRRLRSLRAQLAALDAKDLGGLKKRGLTNESSLLSDHSQS